MSRMRLPGRLSLTSLLLLAGCVSYPFRADIDVRQTASCEGVERVVVETRNGSITVLCEPGRKEASIEATKYASGVTPSDARHHAELIKIEAERDLAEADLLRIVAVFPPGVFGRNMGARLQLTLPSDIALQLETRNGRVSATGATRDVDIRTSNGAVTVATAEGNVRAVTTNGSVTVRDVTGDLDIRSSNGRIELERVGSEHIQVETSNGRIRAVQVRGNAHLESSNGSIELRIASLADQPDIQTVTSNGNVFVELPDAVNARLDMRTSNGRIKTSFGKAAVSDLESSRQHLQAKLNEGGGSIEIVSSNGSITLAMAGSESS